MQVTLEGSGEIPPVASYPLLLHKHLLNMRLFVVVVGGGGGGGGC